MKPRTAPPANPLARRLEKEALRHRRKGTDIDDWLADRLGRLATRATYFRAETPADFDEREAVEEQAREDWIREDALRREAETRAKFAPSAFPLDRDIRLDRLGGPMPED